VITGGGCSKQRAN